ncbi:hypothetical protein MAHJHV63_49760 [Mycobacterium avium subsp. hominissuis]
MPRRDDVGHQDQRRRAGFGHRRRPHQRLAGATTLILVTNIVAARQWKRELVARTSTHSAGAIQPCASMSFHGAS